MEQPYWVCDVEDFQGKLFHPPSDDPFTLHVKEVIILPLLDGNAYLSLQKIPPSYLVLDYSDPLPLLWNAWYLRK